MSKSTDPTFLKTNQYRNSFNLSARANLHQKYSTNPMGWHQWVYDQVDLSTDARILEIGCGPGYLWRENSHSLTSSRQINLTDLSEGMIEEAQEALSGNSSISYTVIDAQDISFPESFFDAVIANHMLYHVPDIPRTLTEIRRVLKPGSCLYAATNGINHLQEIREWEKIFFQETIFGGGFWAERFSLENGGDIIYAEISNQRCVTYLNQLVVTEAEPLIDYLKSKTTDIINQDSLNNFRKYLQDKITNLGSIKISTDAGLYICQKIE
jgi:ubiquinone/menaquinone biosynthesis C-methylase UbiE